MALLLLLLATVPLARLVLAHAEHGLRGEASREDARFVQEMGSRFHLDTATGFLEVREHRRPGEGIEECARRLRLQFLEETARARGALWIATGHTADDLAETVLFHQVRGAGAWGSAGFREVRPPYVRPVVAFTREELRRVLRSQGLSWREDASNDSLEYTRNRIRHTVLPLLETTVHAGATRHLAALGREVAERELRGDRNAETLLPWLRSPFPRVFRAWRATVAMALEDHLLIRLLRLEARSLGWRTLDRHRIEELVPLIRRSPSWRFQWQEDLELVAGGSLLAWVHRSWSHPLDPVPLPSEGTWCWGPWKCHWAPCHIPEPVVAGAWCLALRFPEPPQRSVLTPLALVGEEGRYRTSLPSWCHPWWPTVEDPWGARILPWNWRDVSPQTPKGYDRIERLLVFS